MIYKFKNLLSIGSDSKTVKGEKYGFLTAIMYFAPHTIAGLANVCKFATKHCKFACLYTAGRGGFNSVQIARIARTQFYFANPSRFFEMLEAEIRAFIRLADKRKLRPAIRLNGTSDILWEKSGIIQKFEAVQWYDYTKYPAGLRQNLPANYHLTYSFNGLPISADFSAAWAKRGVNTAAVFRGGLPAEFLGRPVINGDLSDLRFLDPAGCIVGLKAKGKAIKEKSPFVVDVVNGQAVWPADVEKAADPFAAEICRPTDLSESGRTIELKGPELRAYLETRFPAAV